MFYSRAEELFVGMILLLIDKVCLLLDIIKRRKTRI